MFIKVLDKYQNRDFARKAMEDPEDSQKASTVVEVLVPKVIKLDLDGVPVSRQEQVSLEKTVVVEIIDCAK